MVERTLSMLKFVLTDVKRKTHSLFLILSKLKFFDISDFKILI